MFSKTWLMSIVLAAFAVFFGVKTYDIWSLSERPDMKMPAPARKSEAPVKKSVNRRMPSETAYNVVADRNLFSPDRAEFIPEEPESEPEVKPLRVSGKKITLYGVILTDHYQSALIDNPLRGPDERKNKWVKTGDTIGELEVAEIRKGSILLTEGDDTYEIPLYDKTKPKRQGKIKKASKPTVIVSESAKEQKEGQKGAGPKVREINTPFGKMTRKTKKAAEQIVSEEKAPEEAEFEVVDTPFGKVTRRKK
ncbi:hypothetical protein QUF80_05130 [Desulfococcaceae bacterium HSG8]|nr:hypothetical protein [Desulfococcaceae bacterium HSG8]